MPWSLPVRELRSFSDVITAQFRCQAARIFSVNVSSGLVFMWNTLKHTLPETTRSKVVIVNSGSCGELDELVEKDMRLKEYGGT